MLLGEVEAKARLKEAGIGVNETRLARSRGEAVAAAREVGFPAALKIASPDIPHKSDAGGVRLGLATAAQVGQAYDAMLAAVKKSCPGARIEGVSVQPMARPGLEVIIGVSRDELFGPVLMFGLGGLAVEVLRDVAFRVIPLSASDAAAMLREIKGHPLLEGFRGQAAVDTAALEEMILQVSRFIVENPQVAELDLNPVLAYSNGAMAVDARIVTDDSPPPPQERREPPGALDFIFHPASVAVVGASTSPDSPGFDYLHHLVNYGYPGRVYPVSRHHPEIMGLKAYPDLADVPGDIDYVVSCISIEQVPGLLPACRDKGAKAVHIFAARGSETGLPEAKALEAEIRRRAGECGLRLLGPNCMGIYCPETGLSFGFDFPREAGGVGALVQSGGSAVDLIHYGVLNGLRFSKVVSYGNALDINEADLLRYFTDDPATRVILAFIEGLREDGRDFLELIRRAAAVKPVIVCKGGRSPAGLRSALSHTASLTRPSRTWDAAIRQAGGIPVRDIDDLVHLAVAFTCLPPVKGRRLGTGGAGGGRNTVSADQWEEHGFEVVPLPEEIRRDFKRRGSALWYGLDNPADRSLANTVPGDVFNVPDLLMAMAKHPDFDFTCASVAADEHPSSQENYRKVMDFNIAGYIRLRKESPKPFFLIFNSRPLGIEEMDSWRWREIGRLRSRLVAAGVPFFPSVATAADAVSELISYYERRRGGES